MKKALVVASAILTGLQQVMADEKTIAVKDLKDNGFSGSKVSSKFSNTQGLKLNPNELLRVTADEEGKHFKFETMDHISVVIDAKSARGIGNKDAK